MRRMRPKVEPGALDRSRDHRRPNDLSLSKAGRPDRASRRRRACEWSVGRVAKTGLHHRTDRSSFPERSKTSAEEIRVIHADASRTVRVWRPLSRSRANLRSERISADRFWETPNLFLSLRSKTTSDDHSTTPDFDAENRKRERQTRSSVRAEPANGRSLSCSETFLETRRP